MIYPHPQGANSHVSTGWHPPVGNLGELSTGLHETAGLAGNWALDFMAPGGTRFLAPEDGRITRLSGHDPKLGEVEPGIFGWNIFLTTATGIVYFATHLGNRDVWEGRKVKAGTILGHVGHWPHDEGRSHTHLGITHPDGVSASQERIVKVGEAPRVKGHWFLSKKN